MARIRVKLKNLEALTRLAGKLDNPTPMFRRATTAAAAESVKLVLRGFKRQADPYGRAWAPVKKSSGRILVRTGAMRGSFRARVDSAKKFTVFTSVSYAGFHQSGTSRMPRRAMLPFGGNIPKAWERSLGRIWRREILKFLNV